MSDLKPTYEELISLCDACSDLILGGESGWQNMEFDEFKKLVIKSVSSKRANPWIEFNQDDDGTHPSVQQNVITICYENGLCPGIRRFECKEQFEVIQVVYWMSIPELPEITNVNT